MTKQMVSRPDITGPTENKGHGKRAAIRSEIVVLLPVNHDMMPNRAARRAMTVAKGQKRSNREAKKPKKTEAERLKARQSTTNLQVARIGRKDAPKKS